MTTETAAGTEAADPPAERELTRTEVARRTRVDGGRWRRWWRRRPLRRALVVTHRWTALALGLFLVLETTSGAVLLYHTEIFRASHDAFYQHTASATPVSMQQARDIVVAAHPDFTPAWVSQDGGVIAVGDPQFGSAYSVDPGTGRINGSTPTSLNDGFMGWLTNLHDCAFTCEGYPGYQAWLNTPVFAAVTWGGLILVVLGLLMVLLVVTGLVTWWPGMRKFSHGWRVRTGKGRFARDYDLHNVIGMVSLPFVLMWGVTGAAIELPQVKNVWLAITGGDSADESRYEFTADPAPPGAAEVGLDEATRTALRLSPGEVRYVSTPTPDDANYLFSIAGDGYQPFGGRAFFGGDHDVFVDSHNPDHVSVVDDKPQSGPNTFYDKVFEPLHFGWLVNGWWRIVLLVLGIAPLVLMVTALSTWLYRLGAKRRRRRARAAAA